MRGIGMNLGDADFYAKFILGYCRGIHHQAYRRDLIAWLARQDEHLAADVKARVAAGWSRA